MRPKQALFMAKRILVSWLATKNDFEGSQVNVQGPTLRYHEFFWAEEYAEHWLLFTQSNDTKAHHLINALQRLYPERKIKPIPIALSRSEIIDLEAVYPKVQQLLLQQGREQALDLFFSPGAPMMQIAWFLCHQYLGLDTRLVQTTRPEESPQGKAQRLFMNLKREQGMAALVVQHSPETHFSNRAFQSESYCLKGQRLREIYQLAQRIAKVDGIPALILGESGTGKEHLAHWIHEQSNRKNEAFYTINCSALGDSLLESRLFGHRKGSFTGAEQDQIGLLERAHGGTLFLDEIGDISPYMQQTLLRFLQCGEISPIGQNKTKKVDVRIIAATHRDLNLACREGKFRWDLYYRLMSVELELPALRERPSKERKDLVDFFIKQKAQLFNKPLLKFSPSLAHFIEHYPFPGNVRELERLIDRFYVFCDNEVDLKDLPKRMTEPDLVIGNHSLEEVQRQHVLKVFRREQANKTRTAKALGISLNALKRHLRKYGVSDEQA